MDALDPAIETLAAALASAERPIMLTGQRLDPEGIGELAQRESEWGTRADLDRLLMAPGEFWDFFLPVARAAAARTPTPAHRAIDRLQRAGMATAIITQAVDGLHQRAGSRDVVEVYGNVLSARCERCGERYDIEDVAALIALAVDRVPRCGAAGCAYPLRPAGTLWNEALPRDAVERAWELAADTDLMVVVDSDLRTAPIALLPSVPLTHRADLILIGASPTRYDRYARQVIRVVAGADTLTAAADLVSG